MHAVKFTTGVLVLILLSACVGKPDIALLESIEELHYGKSQFNAQEWADKIHAARSWIPARQLDRDSAELATQIEVRLKQSRVKIIGPDYSDSIHSLASKLWMIDNARYSLDLSYYIFTYDEVGLAILSALCKAVGRGVDIRIMFDSLGSFHLTHSPTRALETCADEAGLVKDYDGKPTKNRARIQFVLINAISSFKSWVNRRSHDKLLIKDGMHPTESMVITGGRNISLHYYGIHADGQKDPDTFLDLEMLLQNPRNTQPDSITVGESSSSYFSLLFLHKGNRRVRPTDQDYRSQRLKFDEAHAHIMSIPSIAEAYAEIPEYIEQNATESTVRIVHELANFFTKDTVNDAKLIKSKNVNSIEGLLDKVLAQSNTRGKLKDTVRIVSPYLFIPNYKNKNGDIIYDGAKVMRDVLAQNPDLNFEIITNSVMTSDNYFTQSVIDMDTAPRLLLSPEMHQAWLSGRETGELNPELVESPEWQLAVNNPRIKFYQTGKIDSRLLGGNQDYGKLHAKFFFSEDKGYVGTSNFDYRSRLYNNEMGFYFYSRDTSQGLETEFEKLKAISIRWGSPEWLQMRRRLVDAEGPTSKTTKGQVKRYKRMIKSGLIWLF